MYGQKQQDYRLDSIAEIELGLKKVQHIDLTIDDFYLQDPIEAVFYNIIDVVLIVGLGNKLQFFDLHNQIRRAMTCPLQSSIIGSSAIYDSYIFSQLDKQDKKIRCNITTEGSLSFSKNFTSQFGNIKSPISKNELLPIQITANDFSSIAKKYPGAYVKQPYPEAIADNSLIIDMDATSMYPSNIKQGNISFDCYVARLIPPECYGTIRLLQKYLGTGSYPNTLAFNINKMISDYVKNEVKNTKSEFMQKYYYTTLSLFSKLLMSNKTFDEIINPTNTDESMLLKLVMVPLLDIIYTIYPNSKIYNQFVYDLLYFGKESQWNNDELLKEKYSDGVWILLYPNESNIQMIHLNVNDALNFIYKNTIALSGCIFNKHDDKKGLFVDILNDFAVLRKKHKKLRDTYDENSYNYKFEDNNQNAFKRLMNTCYGLYGLSTFRYSNQWLARSITNNSMHILKTAIDVTENYLSEKFGS